MRRFTDWAVVLLFLVPPYAALTLAAWWSLVDNTPPMVVSYQHARMLRGEAMTRDEAKTLEVTQIRGGAPVYVYREFCIDGEIHGSTRGVWETAAFVWPAPERAIPPMDVGCYARSWRLTTPTSSPSRDTLYKPLLEFRVNPLATVEMSLPAIPLRLLSPADADAAGM